MFDPIKIILSLTLFLSLFGCAHLPPETNAPRAFQFQNDRLGFANETVWNYVDGKPQASRDSKEKTGEHYTRRCFVVCRAAVQFWKFARFDARVPQLSEKEFAERIRQICAIDVWKEALPPEKRIVIPGYSHLHRASQAHPKVFQDNMGLGWPVYFRIGNAPMLIPPTESSQEKLKKEIDADLAAGYPTIVWLINFPSLSINHAVVVYAKKGSRYWVYDPNDHESPHHLSYDASRKKFSYEKMFYFTGGDVDIRPLYRSPFQ